MRQLLIPFLAVGLGLALAGPGRAENSPRAVIEKAIKAFGGDEKIDKYKAARTRSKGTLHAAVDIPFTQETAAQLPGQFKDALHLEVNGMKIDVITVFDGEKGWLKIKDDTKDLDDKLLAEMKEAVHMIRVNRLTALLKDKKHELAPLGEVKVNDKPAVGVKVSTKGFRDVSLYFDKDTGLLAKVERRVVDFMSGQEITEERVVTDYREVEGLKSPKTVTIYRDGKKFMDAEVVEVKLVDKIDPSEFSKP